MSKLLIISITCLDFNGVFSRNDLSIIKDGAYVINLNDKKSKRKQWDLLFADRNTAVYFDSLGI